MNQYRHLFPLSIQMVLPDNFMENEGFKQNLKILQDYGFYGVELNIADPGIVNFTNIQHFLQNYQLKMTMFASGLTAKTFNLSFSEDDDDSRKNSVKQCKKMIDFVEGSDVGIIVGFLKGSSVSDVAQAQVLFLNSLAKISNYAQEKKVNILIEATNKGESSIANTLEETVNLIKGFNNPYLKILPDTYHMYIEEKNQWDDLIKYKNYYESLHISDNNRCFPGLGTINFNEIFKLLKKINYSGGIAIEGNIKDSFAKDIKLSMNYLIPILSSYLE